MIPAKYRSEYYSWQSMKQRCLNPKATDYFRYGGSGVTIAPEFMDFKAFYKHIGPRPKGFSLDRKDGSLGYVPGNIRWAPPIVQTQNRKSTIWVTYQGKTKTLAEWCRQLGLNLRRVRARINYGFPPEKAFQQTNHSERLLSFNGKTQSASKWARELGLPFGTIAQRLAKQWPVDKVLNTPLRITKKTRSTFRQSSDLAAFRPS
jgi:hypothetical protein